MKPSNGNLLNDGHDNGTKGGLSVKKYVKFGNLLWPKKFQSFLELILRVDKSSLLTG